MDVSICDRLLALQPNQRVQLMRKFFTQIPSDSWLTLLAEKWDTAQLRKLVDDLNLNFDPTIRQNESSPFLFREGFMEIPQFVARLDEVYGNVDLMLANLDILLDKVPEQKCQEQCCSDVCSCQYCQDQGGRNPLERPTYMLYYQAEAPLPTVVCLNHMTTLVCTQCKKQCEDTDNLPDPYDDVQDGYYFSPIKVGDKTFMSWLCKSHPGHYGVCTECEKAGIFCYYLVRYVNNFCHFSLIRPCKVFDLKNASALHTRFETKIAYLTGLVLNLLQHKQYFSSIMYILFMNVKSWEDAVGVLNGDLTDDSYFHDKDKIKRDLCGWKSPTFLFHERLCDVFEQINPELKHQTLTRKIQKMSQRMKKRQSEQTTLQHQLDQILKEKLELQKQLTTLSAKTKDDVLKNELTQLRVANTELTKRVKQLEMEVAIDQGQHDELFRQKMAAERERDRYKKQCQDLEKKLDTELRLRKTVEQHKLTVERKLNQMSTKMNNLIQQEVQRAKAPLLTKINQLQQQHRSRLQPVSHQHTTPITPVVAPNTYLSDYFSNL